MQKTKRHNLILDLITRGSVARQAELASLLRDNGFDVTQASVSRDLDELGVVKVGGRYVQSGIARPDGSPFGIRAVETSGENLVVIKSAAGMASAAAVRIDGEDMGEIVGTIAGDDTIFIAVVDAGSQRTAQRKLRALFAQ